MASKHILLLKELKRQGIGEPFNISPFMVNNFKKPINTDPNKWYDEVRPQRLFLIDLFDRGFIRYNFPDEDEGKTFIYFDGDVYVGYWFDEVASVVYLTSTGLDYLEKYDSDKINNDLNKSYINVNSASIKNYRNQLIGLLITIFISGTAAWFAYKDYTKPEPKMVELNKNIQSLSKETQGIKEQLKRIEVQVSSRRDSSRKP